jgi:predicted aspartyl protease
MTAWYMWPMGETSGTRRRGLVTASGLLACVLAVIVPTGASAQENTVVLPETPAEEPPVTALPDVTVSAPEPRYVAPTTRDRIGRIWAPVLINGEGPFRLVLDTGASRSAILPRVAEALKLPIAVNSIQLRGVTGSAIASSITVDTLEVGDLILQGTTMPIVEDVFGGADGVLGAEGLADKRIVIEFRRDRISILYSHRQEAPYGFLTLPFKFEHNRGVRIPVVIGGVRVVGVIDTGAQATVGNLALREALARRRKEATPEEASIIGVTLDIQQADRARIPSFFAGDLLVRNANIMFTDLHIFDHWGLSSEPAVLIGMDILGVLDTLIIDYSRSELQIRTSR